MHQKSIAADRAVYGFLSLRKYGNVELASSKEASEGFRAAMAHAADMKAPA